MVVKKNNNAPLVGAIIFLALVIGAAAIYLGTQKNNEASISIPTTPTPNTTQPTTIPSHTAFVSVPPLQKQTIEKLKESSFVTYSIEYPSGWTGKIDNSNGVTSTFTLTRGSNEIKIYQAPQGGAGCIFEGIVPEGPVNDYTKSKYVSIETNQATLRRIIPEKEVGKTTYSFCSNSTTSKTTYGTPTMYGGITYTVENSSKEILYEMDKILSSLIAQ